eukprot:g4695.t1
MTDAKETTTEVEKEDEEMKKNDGVTGNVEETETIKEKEEEEDPWVPTLGVLQEYEKLRERNRKRAKRFGVEYVDPDPREVGLSPAELKRLTRLDRKGASKNQFTPGFDITSEEELKKREARAKKFGIDVAPPQISKLTGLSAEELEARKKRAEKFKVENKVEVEIVSRVWNQIAKLGTEHVDQPIRKDTLQFFNGRIQGLRPASTKTFLLNFHDYAAVYVEWIDGNRCNVTFKDEASALRVFKNLTAPVPCNSVDEEHKRRALACWRVPLEPMITERSKSKVPYIVRFATTAPIDSKKRKTTKKDPKFRDYRAERPNRSMKRHRGGGRRPDTTGGGSGGKRRRQNVGSSISDRMGSALSSRR